MGSGVQLQSAGQKRKTALTPFYDSLSVKRRRLNDSTDAVMSPLVSSTTPTDRLSLHVGSTPGNRLHSTTSRITTRSRDGYGDENHFEKKSYSSKRYNFNSNNAFDEDDDYVEVDDDDDSSNMYGEEYSITLTQSRSWCSLM